MGEEQNKHVENWNKEVSTAVGSFAEHCSKITVRFPELKGYQPGKNTADIEKINNRICTDTGFVRQLYSGQKRGWPTADEIDERWALYRWLQIRVLAALEYFRKYGERNASLATVNIEHDYRDLEYCLVACMVGALATSDKGIATRFLALHSSGILL